MSSDPPTAKEINDALHDFGFHHPLSVVKRMFAEYVNNKKYWYGENGIDQPDEYWEDISTMNWLRLWVEHVAPLAQVQAQVSQEDAISRLRRGGTLNG